MKRLTCLAAALLIGCASVPPGTGVNTFSELLRQEKVALRGDMPWSIFYTNAIDMLDTLEPDEFQTQLRGYYTAMLPHAQDFAAGRIDAKEFLAVRDHKLAEYRPRFQAAQRGTLKAKGERTGQPVNYAAILDALFIGVSAATLLSPAPRPAPTNCITSAQGNYLNTTCR